MTENADRSSVGELTDGAIHTQYDWNKTAPSTAVIETVAIAVDREPTALDTLYDYVSSDALDAIVKRGDGDAITVSFEYSSRQVTVHSAGDIVVSPLSNAA